MAVICDCDNVSLNTGIPSCVSIPDITRCLVFTTELDSTGSVKQYSKDDLDEFSFVELELNAPIFDDRFLPTPELENVENLRDEAVFQEFNSGNKAKVRDGFKNFTGYIVQAPNELVGQLKRLACSDFGAYIVDKNGNFVGYKASTTTDLRPILIDKNSLNVQWVEATDSEVAMIMISFQWRQSMLDENLRLISADTMDYNCSDLYGLLNVYGTPLMSSATEFSVTLTTLYGTAVDGLVAGDFVLTNETTGLPVTPVSVTALANGVYDFVIPAQTGGDILSLSGLKDRFDFSTLATSTFEAL